MTDCLASCKVRWSECHCINYNLAKNIDANGKFANTEGTQLSLPILFPKGDDWKALLSMASKVKFNAIDVRIKPWDNFIVPGTDTKGVVSGDFPVYLVVYPGNTFNDKNEAMTISSACVNGKYAQGTRTTVISGSFPNIIYNTMSSDNSGDVTKILNKNTITTSIDCEALESQNNVYQAGKVVVGIKPEDFVATEVINGEGSGSQAGAIKRYLKDKGSKEVEEFTTGRKGRRQPPPEPSFDPSKFFPDQLDDEGNLYAKYWFWLEVTADVTYEVKHNAAK